MLPTGDPLGTVVTMLATPFGRLDGLAIDTAGAGGWRPTGSPPDSPSEGVIDGLPGSVSFPRRKVVVDGPPWGKIVGQRSPDTAIAVAVEDGINHGSHLGLAWPPTGAGRRQEGLQDSPLLACQITGVWLRPASLRRAGAFVSVPRVGRWLPLQWLLRLSIRPKASGPGHAIPVGGDRLDDDGNFHGMPLVLDPTPNPFILHRR